MGVVEETRDTQPEPKPLDETEHSLLTLHEAGETEPLEFWWRTQHDV